MRSCVCVLVALVSSGCPGNPVEGEISADASTASSTSAGGEAGTTVSDAGEASVTSAEGSASAEASVGDTSTMSATETDEDLETTLDPSAGESSTGTTGAGACAEDGEPNDEEAAATLLAPIACDATASAKGLADALTSPDWWRFYGDYDATLCGSTSTDHAHPRVQVIAGGPLPVCAFVTCVSAAGIACMTGLPAISPSGRDGCCAIDDVQLAVNCSGSDESTDVLVSVDTTAALCSEYTLQLGF